MAVALIVGGASCVWEDAVQALEMFSPDGVFVINDMMGIWPLRIDYGVTLHADKLYMFLKRGRGANLRVAYPVWSHRRPSGNVGQFIDHTTTDWSGSSGLLAVKVAIREEKFEGAVLAGVPMEQEAKHIVRGEVWTSAGMFQKGWTKHFGEIEGKVKSMSGFTKGLLGVPTPEWLKSKGSAPPNPEWVRKLKEKADGQSKSRS